MVKGDVIEFKDTIPLQYLAHKPKFTVQEELLIDKMLEEMLEKEIIKEAVYEELESVSPIFITTKSDGGVCLILNMKRLIEFIKYEHFKMDDIIKDILNVITKNCYMDNNRLERCVLQC